MTAAFIGIDWGTTNRRAYRLAADGALLDSFGDDQGLLAAQGHFPEALATVLDHWSLADARVLLSGMVGSRNGWREAPYLDATVPMRDLPFHLMPIGSDPNARTLDCRIAPGYRWSDVEGPDVMRGEETQILGALELGASDGWFVLPGTHSKWVRIENGVLRDLRTFMTGELFATMTHSGTLAGLMSDAVESTAAFAAGVGAAKNGALSHTLFGCRARVVVDAMPSTEARSYLSGLLIGAEWHDIRARQREPLQRIEIIGSPALAHDYARVAAMFDVQSMTHEPDQVYVAALRRFMAAWR
jgi:2-dehydro-3-deoxygalactonokinase